MKLTFQILSSPSNCMIKISYDTILDEKYIIYTKINIIHYLKTARN